MLRRLASNALFTASTALVFFFLNLPVVAQNFFSPASGSPITTGSGPNFVAFADLNKDGKLDLVVVNSGGSSGSGADTVSVLLGLGAGQFAAPVNYGTGRGPMEVAIADFNHDGNLDLAVTNSGDNTVSILLGTGTGTFQAALPFLLNGTGSSPAGIALGDFNNDGILDLAIANNTGSNVSLLLGTGNSSLFQPATSVPTGNAPAAVAVGDLNGDGKLDLITANNNDNTVSVLFGNGNGTFQPKVDYAAGSDPDALVIADLNADGRLDIAVASTTSGDVSVLLNNGGGVFAAAVSYPTGANGSGSPESITAADFNGDGKIDLVVADQFTNTASFLLGNGNGTFQGFTAVPTGNNPIAVRAADLNGDGKPDIVVANFLDNTVSVLLNNGNITGGVGGGGTGTGGSGGAGFTITANPSTATVTAGQLANFLITVTPGTGFTGTVSFTCSGIPASGCSFSPRTVTPNGVPANTNMTVATNFTSNGPPRVSAPDPHLGRDSSSPVYAMLSTAGFAGFVLAGTFTMGRRRRTAIRIALLTIAVVLVVLVQGCGTGVTHKTPPGVYSLNITGSAEVSGSTQSASTSVNLTVNQ